MAEKTLKIYMDNNDYVMERINEFNHAFKKHYSKPGLIEALQQYKTLGQLDKYEIEANKDVWELVINTLGKEV